jgi:hypothetical protein
LLDEVAETKLHWKTMQFGEQQKMEMKSHQDLVQKKMLAVTEK